MVDVLTPSQRSYNMSRIRWKDTRPEIILRKLLWAKGIRGYRINFKIHGKPDIVFLRKKIVIFVDGCYWHRCPLHFQEPDTRKDFWMKKIESNVARDRKVDELLTREGWTVIRIWEHEIKNNPEDVLRKIESYL